MILDIQNYNSNVQQQKIQFTNSDVPSKIWQLGLEDLQPVTQEILLRLCQNNAIYKNLISYAN